MKSGGDRLHGLLEDGCRLEEAGDFQNAVRLYREALSLEPADSRPLHRLGVVAYRIGRLEEAKVLIQRAIATGPDCWAYHRDLGNVYKRKGNLTAAENSLQRAVSLAPESAEAHYDLGIVHHIAGRLEKALICYQACTERDPAYAPAWNNLGLVHQKLGDCKSAVECFKSAIKWKPDFTGAHINLGHVFSDGGDLNQATSAYRKATESDPKLAVGHSSLGNAYLKMEKLNEAVACYKRATALQPHIANHWVNLGAAFQGLDDKRQAIHCYRKALSLNSEIPQALHNLGLVYKDLGRHTDALECLQRALEIDPEYESALESLVNLLITLCDWDAAEFYGQKLDRLTERDLKVGDKPCETPFLNLIRHMDPVLNYKVARAWSRELEKHLQIVLNQPSYSAKYHSDSKIRIGYLSGNFCNHPTADLTQGLFALHDRDHFRISCYAYGKDDGSKQRARIAASSDRFYDIDAMDDRSAAGLIQRHGINILIDLMGFTRGARLGICVRRPAPIQVRMLGMAGTTGASFFDYLITDRTITPKDQQSNYSEHFVYMPDIYQINAYRLDQAFIRPPIESGEKRSHFIFGCFCTAYKIERSVFEAWMRILLRVPGSKLWLMPESARVKRNLSQTAGSMGVDPSRIIFLEKLQKKDHFRRLVQVDLALDTLTVNGAATTSDALWAGVPVITVKGRHFASRMSSSLLYSMGLPEMVTDSLSAYIKLAIELATDPKLLIEIKHRLEKNRLLGPLFNTDQFVKYLEAAYSCMWDRHVTGSAVEPIDIRRLISDSADCAGMLETGENCLKH